MQNIQAVLERRVLLLGNLNEILEERRLRNSEGLREQNILPVWKQTKRKFHKVQTPRFEDLIRAEKINNDGVLAFVGNLRQGIHLQSVDEMLEFTVVGTDGARRQHFVGLLLLAFHLLLCFVLQSLALKEAHLGKSDVELPHRIQRFLEGAVAGHLLKYVHVLDGNHLLLLELIISLLSCIFFAFLNRIFLSFFGLFFFFLSGILLHWLKLNFLL